MAHVGAHLSLLIEIIDDDDAVRDSIRLLLECLGYEVRDYSSGVAFLSDRSADSDCIVVDQHMPGMEGLAVLEHLRTAGDKTPALIITGRSDQAIEPRAAVLGVKVLHKPLSEEHLVANIELLCHDRK